jgi:hypothetical protein
MFKPGTEAMNNTGIREASLFGVYWFKNGGGVISYRFLKTEADWRIEALQRTGLVPIKDPFSKGAPTGGYSTHDIIGECYEPNS